MSGFGGLFWVRRVCWRVNISLPERKTARHLCEILSSYSFDGIREELRTTQYFALFAYPLKLFYLSVKRDPTSCMALCVARSSTPPANTEELRSPFFRARWCRADRIWGVPRGKIACPDRSISTASHLRATLVRLPSAPISCLV